MTRFALVLLLPILTVGCATSEPEPESRPHHEVEVLASALQSKNPATRRQGIERLGELGRTDPAACDVLLGFLAAYPAERLQTHNGTREHDQVAEALRKCGQRAMPGLIRALDHPWWTVRRAAALALCRLRKDADQALPELIEMAVRDPEPALRRIGLRSFLYLSRQQESLEAALAAAADPDRDVRYEAVVTVGFLAIELDAATEVIPALIGLMESEDRVELEPTLRDLEPGPTRHFRAAAAIALGRLGPAGREAIPALETARFDRDPEVRRAAILALSRLRDED